ncbi:unnamed protein product [Oikopleura dioica]|uniref:Polypeptide N-acetylgalactosaminyltransferase n=1 Tax=Oikopleura dioica TaxID=34765 RepID=E4YFY9_OIKDI|nr:unnamed protein product [Oikopleura dioica]
MRTVRIHVKSVIKLAVIFGCFGGIMFAMWPKTTEEFIRETENSYKNLKQRAFEIAASDGKLRLEDIDPNSANGFPKLTKDEIGNYEPKDWKVPAGPGEGGVEPLKLDDSTEMQKKQKDAINEYGFNMVASDAISLDRYPADLRHEECKHYQYPESLPASSVIFVFHNEGWSTLVRSIHSVINYTPPELLEEVVLIDDGSNKEHITGGRLEEHIKQWNGLVKLYRNDRREGLIRARSIGARKAVGSVLIYLDAHCEVEPNWIVPLVEPMVHDYRICTVPMVDAIDGATYVFTPQAGGDENNFARGAWDWDLLWKRIPLNDRERARQEHMTSPYRSPAMAGGLFAISRKFFFELGLYDEGLDIWGGENFEISYKIWMCHGQMLFVPCSRVGHIYRMKGWRGNGTPSYVKGNFVDRNYVRVVEVWWDEYSKYFYERKPNAKHVDPGDLTEVKAVRERLQCKSFDWFMKEIGYDLPKHFPLVEPSNAARGHITNVGTNLCVDGHHAGQGDQLALSECASVREGQWMLTWHEDIRPLSGSNVENKKASDARKVCWDGTGVGNPIGFWECHTQGGNQLFKYVPDKKQFIHSPSRACATANEEQKKVYLKACDDSNDNQKWWWDKQDDATLARQNKDMMNHIDPPELDYLS